MWSCEFPVHVCAHLHLQAPLHIKKELSCSESSGPEQSQDTSLDCVQENTAN